MTGNYNICELLLKAKAEVNKQDWDNCAPLHFAAEKGFCNIAQLLLDHGAAINIQTRSRETPLIRALQADHHEMIDYLLSMHAELKKPALLHRSPLFFAKSEQAATSMVRAGAVVNYHDDSNQTPLHVASKNGMLGVATVLIANGAELNAQDVNKQTPLHLAAEAGNAEIVNLLLSSGAALKVQDISGQTPEMLAKAAQNYAVLTAISTYHEEHGDAGLDSGPLQFH